MGECHYDVQTGESGVATVSYTSIATWQFPFVCFPFWEGWLEGAWKFHPASPQIEPMPMNSWNKNHVGNLFERWGVHAGCESCCTWDILSLIRNIMFQRQNNYMPMHHDRGWLLAPQILICPFLVHLELVPRIFLPCALHTSHPKNCLISTFKLTDLDTLTWTEE